LRQKELDASAYLGLSYCARENCLKRRVKLVYSNTAKELAPKELFDIAGDAPYPPDDCCLLMCVLGEVICCLAQPAAGKTNLNMQKPWIFRTGMSGKYPSL
jgi:hypothetical protein